MNKPHHLIRKTFLVGFFTFLSRISGFLRTILQARYLGVGVTSDAFITAFRVPNLLRKIFAEGALSAAVTPTLVRVVRNNGIHEASKLVCLLFLCIETLLLLCCSLIWIYAGPVITFISPGFTAEQHTLALPLLRILISFIFFVSSSALFAGALQAVHHFTIPAAGQIILNIVTIIGLAICMLYNLPTTTFAWFIIAGSALLLLAHAVAYIHLNFTFELPDRAAAASLWSVLGKFVPCLISISPVEIISLIDGQFASYLPHGSVTRISYATDFMRIPLGIFVIAFSTILLPHLARVSTYAPKRLGFYLLESTKLIFWVTIPSALLMGFFSYDIFYTIFLSKNFTLTDIQEVAHLLIAALAGLFFFSINKILLNMYYALHATTLPALITIVSLVCNIGLNMLLMPQFGSLGLVMAMSLSALIQTIAFLVGLHYVFNFTFYVKQFMHFVLKYCIQLICIFTPSYLLYRSIAYCITLLPTCWSYILLQSIGLWFWVGPLCGLMALIVFYTRKKFGVQLYFLKYKG